MERILIELGVPSRLMVNSGVLRRETRRRGGRGAYLSVYKRLGGPSSHWVDLNRPQLASGLEWG